MDSNSNEEDLYKTAYESIKSDSVENLKKIVPEFLKADSSFPNQYSEQCRNNLPFIHFAIVSNSFECVKYLIEFGCNLNDSINESGYAPIHLCAIIDNLDIVKAILNVSNLDFYNIGSIGHTALDIAFLLQKISNFDLIISSLINREKEKNPSFNRKIFLRELNFNNKSCYLSAAVQINYLKFIEYLIFDVGFDVNDKGNLSTSIYPLFEAIIEENFEITKYFINLPEINIDITFSGMLLANFFVNNLPVIHLAISTESLKMVELVLSSHLIKVNQCDENNDTCLHFMLRNLNFNIEIFEFVCNFDGASFDINKKGAKGETLLHLLIKRNKIQYFTGKYENLLRRINPHIKDESGNTPYDYLLVDSNYFYSICIILSFTNIYLPCNCADKSFQLFINKLIKNASDFPFWVLKNWQYPPFRAFKILIDNGLDPNCIADDGKCLLSYACECQANNYVQMILGTRKVNPNDSDEYGNSAIHYAVRNKRSIESLRLLMLFPGLDLNKVNSIGNTPLIEALECRNTFAITLLLDNPKVNISIPNIKGEMPIFVAIKKNLNTVFDRIITDKNLDIRLRIKNVTSITKENENILHYICQNGNVLYLKQLYCFPKESNFEKAIESIDPNLQTIAGSPLAYAIGNNYIEIIKFFLNNIKNVNISCITNNVFTYFLWSFPLLIYISALEAARRLGNNDIAYLIHSFIQSSK